MRIARSGLRCYVEENTSYLPVLEQGVPTSACEGTHGEAAFAGPDAHN